MVVTSLDVREALLRRGHPALAWEVLRRVPAYRSAYDALRDAGQVNGDAGRALAARWGLHFR